MIKIERQENDIILLRREDEILEINYDEDNSITWTIVNKDRSNHFFIITPEDRDVYYSFSELYYYLTQDEKSLISNDKEQNNEWKISLQGQDYILEIDNQKVQTCFSLPFLFFFWSLQNHQEEPYHQIDMEEYVYQKRK